MRLPSLVALSILLAAPLSAAPAAAQTYRVEGRDDARGGFTGRLVLGDPGALGRREARLERWFAGTGAGASDAASGALTPAADALRGTLRASVGAAGQLAGSTPPTFELELKVEGQTCRGSGKGAAGALRFVGRVAVAGTTPLPPRRVAAAALTAPNAAARKQLAAWADIPGVTAAFPLAANGGRPVVVHLSPGFDPQAPARVLVYLHGHGWDVGPALAQHKVFARIEALGAADPQTVFVFPQAGPPPFKTWLKPPGESLRGIVDGALAAAATLAKAPALTITRRQVDAHSGAGLALANAALAGELEFDKIGLIDSAYGTWAQTVARWAAKAPHGPRIESWYTNHASQADNNREAARLAPGRMTVHPVGSGSLHNVLPSRYLGTE
ncbi:MAG: hypothetical protein AB7N76_29210 [Planctomycetota bacterium]